MSKGLWYDELPEIHSQGEVQAVAGAVRARVTPGKGDVRT
jgi:hypothetical protein